MQLAITALSTRSAPYLTDMLSAINNCKCNVVELRTSQLAEISATYLLIEGNWNQVAKLESLLENLQTRLDLQIQLMRPDTTKSSREAMPYCLETMSLYRNDIIQDIITFLMTRNIGVEEISASQYHAHYCDNSVFSTRFIVSVPTNVRLLSFREEFLDFCDNLNLDAILEPIKR